MITRAVRPGEEVELRIEAESEWVFLTPQYRILCPKTEDHTVTVVLVKRGDREILASDRAKKDIVQSLLRLIDAGFQIEPRSGDEQRKKIALEEVARNLGLSSEVIDQAIRSWKDHTEDPLELGLAALYEKKFPEAVVQLNKAYDEAKSSFEKKKGELAQKAFYLGKAFDGEGNYKEALVKFREASELQPSQVDYTRWLAFALAKMGRNREAEQYLIDLSTHNREILGEEDPATMTSMNNLAHSLKAQGDLACARALNEKVLKISRRTLG